MLRLISDVNFNGQILRGLRRRLPGLDLVRAWDAGLGKADDPSLLQWSAAENRILLTHDVNTIPGFACDRVRASQAMPGFFWSTNPWQLGKPSRSWSWPSSVLSPEDCKHQVIYFPM